MWGSSGLELSAWVVFCLGCLLLGSLWRLVLWFLRNVARNSPTCISNVEIASFEFCGFLDTYEKLGYPNYVRVLVDEAPKANSCVRSSSHDTAHDPRDALNTTHTPQCEEPPILLSRDRGLPPEPAQASRLANPHQGKRAGGAGPGLVPESRERDGPLSRAGPHPCKMGSWTVRTRGPFSRPPGAIRNALLSRTVRDRRDHRRWEPTCVTTN